MTAQEYLSLWGGPAEPDCFLTSFLRHVDDDPERVAVVDAGRDYTYRDLAAWAGALSADLRAAGVTSGDRVAVTLPRGAGAVAALLGVMLGGATYVPLDPEYPTERLQFMIDDCVPQALIAAEHTGVRYDGPMVRVGEAPQAIESATATATESATESASVGVRPVPCDPDLPVYVIYTSGSTGWPKGVALSHRCVDAMVDWQVSHSPRPDLRTAQFAPLNFDVSFQEILGTLCGGGTLSIMPEELRREPGRLLRWLAENRIERLFVPFVALQMLAVTARPEVLERLRLVEVNTAGEQIVCSEDIRSMFAGLPGCRLVNHYGQSESAMVSSHVLPADPQSWPHLPPIGVPLPGCEVLVDPEDPDTPHIGELLVAGHPLSDGYLGRPELTSQRYVTVAPTPAGHTRAFRTGDLVELTPDGVRFLSRLDDQIKIRGIRVDLLEVDAQLLADPGVAAAATAMVTSRSGHASLRAAVVRRAGRTEPAEAATLGRLREVLPTVSVPLSVTELTELPRTPSGKIDREAVVELISDDLVRRRRRRKDGRA
ncbi:amino acid adenylation domain-containing protein [Streptomyces aureocirculatus]|uniref:amino acid adenylation domain-containing protein n=1 Tax=Streptomyces aureocirculatus TaxID=67275 RepID=UPI00068EAE0C|nr:amino acid adenylation domain-containing protein [Streptomyces aureocirculatus]